MKILKVCIFTFIALIPIMLIVGVELYFNHREQQCIDYWQQQGYNLEQSQFICSDD